MRIRLLALFAVFAVPSLVRADEGMWSYDNLPRETLAKKYGFSPDTAWLESAQRSSLRIAGGCSGSFVSPEGLVMTNHHCVRACVGQLSSKAHDYLAGGFYAAAPEAETRCPEIELNELLAITDVSARLQTALHGAKPGSPEAAKLQQSEKAAIEKECAGGDDKLRCEVVDLYHGGVHALYRYHRYQDVRLVFAPEQAAPKFGGDPDNFEFPRWSLDASFLRAYEGGKPAHPEHWFKWSASGPKDGELTFVSGNPGSTRREYTVAEVVNDRDVVIPERLLELAEQRGMFTQYASESAEHQRITSAELLRIENSYKGLRGRLDALLDPAFLAGKEKEEQQLRADVKRHSALQKEAGNAWSALAHAVDEFRPRRKEYDFVEGTTSHALAREPHWFMDAKLLKFGRLLVRSPELQKPDGTRLREWSDSRRPAIEQALFSTAPIAKQFEELKLAYGLTRLREQLGTTHPFVKKLLGDKSPQELAHQLVTETHLDDLAVRKQLFAGGQAAIDASTDPIIVLLRALDSDGRTIRGWYEEQIAAREEAATEAIAHARFALYGTKHYPDATFTLRLSYGAVKGFAHDGYPVTPFTDFSSAFAHQTGREPFQLPDSWNIAKGKLDLAVPFNFVTDNDIIGGNSGSPAFNQKQEITGLIFDGNHQSLAGDYYYDGSENRAVAVDSAAILQALEKIYGATRVLDELRPPAPAAAAAGASGAK